MSPSSPKEAVQISLDLGSKQSLAMHWGTFLLTDEEVLEPHALLKKALEEKNLDQKYFITLKPGEVFNETVKTLTKNQTAAATSSLNQSLNRIAGRMNYIRSTNNNSSNQNIRLAMNLDNPLVTEMLNKLSTNLLQKQKKTQRC